MATIAVIDSNPTERAAVTAGLRRIGHDVLEWSRATPCRHALFERAPDLLLVAAELQDGDGVDLAARLRARHPRPFPIVVLSGDPDDHARSAAAGASDLALRPLELDPLLQLVRRLLLASHENTAQVELPRGSDGLAFGRYAVRGVLGRGSYGIVYDAWDTRRHEAVALKVLDPVAEEGEEDVLARFVREARVLAEVRSPHVVAMLDAGRADGRAYCAMRRLQGPTLEVHQLREGNLSELQTLALLWSLLSALDALGERDLVHRDVTPKNVILDEGRVVRPVLIDFGLAKRTRERGLTSPDVILGTPGFIAPEVICGAEADARSDLFAAGLVAVHALTGSRPFPGLRGMQLLRHTVSTPTPMPPWLSTPAQDLLRRLTALDPRDRPSSAHAALEELANLAWQLTRPIAA